jgi:hypothetical protein
MAFRMALFRRLGNVERFVKIRKVFSWKLIRQLVQYLPLVEKWEIDSIKTRGKWTGQIGLLFSAPVNGSHTFYNSRKTQEKNYF